jgi:hypothetical protein
VKLYYDDLVLPSTGDKTLNKCQQTIGKASAAFLAAKTKALAKCWDGVNKAVPGPCPLPGDGRRRARSRPPRRRRSPPSARPAVAPTRAAIRR